MLGTKTGSFSSPRPLWKTLLREIQTGVILSLPILVAFCLTSCSGLVAPATSKPGDTAAAPAIASLSPTSGVVGASVTIAGANFGSTQGTNSVVFNGTAATVTSWNLTGIV